MMTMGQSELSELRVSWLAFLVKSDSDLKTHSRMQPYRGHWPCTSLSMVPLTKASHVGRYDTTARTSPYERIFTMALFILIRYIFHSCHLVSSIYLYLFSTYLSILHACLFTSVPSEASLLPPSFPSCRLDSLATSLAQSKLN